MIYLTLNSDSDFDYLLTISDYTPDMSLHKGKKITGKQILILRLSGLLDFQNWNYWSVENHCFISWSVENQNWNHWSVENQCSTSWSVENHSLTSWSVENQSLTHWSVEM